MSKNYLRTRAVYRRNFCTAAVQWATPEELYQRPRTDWLAGFIGKGSVLEVAGQPLGHIDGQASTDALDRGGLCK